MEFRELLERVLRGQEGLAGLEVREVREVECTEPGDNYMSDVAVAEVRGQLPAGRPYAGRVFVKRPPGSATGRALGSDAAFANEALVYGRLLPLPHPHTVCARCLHAAPDLVLLQDLSELGYRMPRRPSGLPPPLVPSVLRALAKFHGWSYGRLQTSESFREAAARLRPVGPLAPAAADDGTLEAALARMRRLAGESWGAEGWEGRLLARLAALRRPGPVAVLAHGDFWLNNIMVDETRDEPVKIVDLQACAVAGPGVDVWTLLYTSVEPARLREDGGAGRLVDLYCRHFLDAAAAASAGLPADRLPTTDALSQDILRREPYGLLAAAVYLPALFLSRPRDEVLAAGGELEGMLDVGQLRARVRGLLAVCARRGVLDNV